jgi:hypothetical protein
MDDEENVVKVNFKEKRPRLGDKPKLPFFQSKTAGLVVAGALIALGLAAHIFLTSP